jgi:hypothetical protein
LIKSLYLGRSLKENTMMAGRVDEEVQRQCWFEEDNLEE